MDEKNVLTKIWGGRLRPWAAVDSPGAASYAQWRDAKMAHMPRGPEDLVVEIGGLGNVSPAQAKALLDRLRSTNMAIYSCRDPYVDRAAIRDFAAQFGLHRLDHHLCAGEGGVTALKVADGGRRGGYVPYSNRALSWHTDGYYNAGAGQIHAVVLHCASVSASGGENALLDPEIAYIALHDENPDFTAALMHPHCMTIPANHEGGREIRPARSGPVFSFGPVTGALHMRYTARKKNVVWRNDPTTLAAVAFLNELLGGDDGPALHCRLAPGQGIISANVLHNRAAFDDGPAGERLVYRARYFDRIQTTQ